MRLMRVTSLKIFNYYPLWKKWRVDRYEPSHTISLLVGLFGLISSYWTVTIWFTSSIHQSISEIVNTSQFITEVLSIFWIPLLSSFFFASGSLFVLIQVSDNLSVNSLKTQWSEFKEIVFQTVSLKIEEESENEVIDENEIAKTSRNYLITYISITFFMGFAAGTLYSLIYYIPYFMVDILFAFIISMVFGIDFALPTAMLLSWLVFIWYIIRGKLNKEVSPEKLVDFQQDFQYSNRTYEILASKKEPIICPSCRSYISADSKNCKVCGDKLIID